MTFFSTKFIDFFSGLESNNSTDWFDTNRRVYENNVKEPFYDFIDELILQLRAYDSELEIEPEKAIFRINNDIRYLKEKIPYKTWMSAHISMTGKKVKDCPGFFIKLNHKEVTLAGGVYNPTKDKLKQIRESIIEQPKVFLAACRNNEFLNRFGGFKSEKNKILPEEYKNLAKEIPELYNKQFYYSAKMDAIELIKPTLINKILNVYKSSIEIHHFLKNSVRDLVEV